MALEDRDGWLQQAHDRCDCRWPSTTAPSSCHLCCIPRATRQSLPAPLERPHRGAQCRRSSSHSCSETAGKPLEVRDGRAPSCCRPKWLPRRCPCCIVVCNGRGGVGDCSRTLRGCCATSRSCDSRMVWENGGQATKERARQRLTLMEFRPERRRRPRDRRSLRHPLARCLVGASRGTIMSSKTREPGRPRCL